MASRLAALAAEHDLGEEIAAVLAVMSWRQARLSAALAWAVLGRRTRVR